MSVLPRSAFSPFDVVAGRRSAPGRSIVQTGTAGSPVAHPVCMVGRMTSLGLPRRAASANGSEGPMSATVARTGSGRPEATTGRFTVRVTHTLPFPAAAAIAPDVCDDCTTRFSQGGPSACRMGENPTRGGPRSAGAAAAVASTHCCGSHFGAIPCMPTGGSPADRMPPRSVADAGDGVPYTAGRLEHEPLRGGRPRPYGRSACATAVQAQRREAWGEPPPDAASSVIRPRPYGRSAFTWHGDRCHAERHTG